MELTEINSICSKQLRIKISKSDYLQTTYNTKVTEMIRIIASLWRENLLDYDSSIVFTFIFQDQSYSQIDSWHKVRRLRSKKNQHKVTEIYCQGDLNLRIENIETLLIVIKPLLTNSLGETTDENWNTFIELSEQSVLHESISRIYKRNWRKAFENTDFIDHLFSLSERNTYSLANQIAAFNPRLTPFSKTVIGIDLENQLRFSPDFNNTVDVIILFIKSEALLNNCSKQNEQVMLEELGIVDQVEAFLNNKKIDLEGYTVFPVHPLHYSFFISNIKEGYILHSNIKVKTSPSLSYRTMIPEYSIFNVKLPVPIQTTHIQRNLRITEILGASNDFNSFLANSFRSIQNRGIEAYFCQDVYSDMIKKEYLLNNRGANEQVQTFFSFLIREAPYKFCNKGSIVIPAATLESIIPNDQVPLIIALISRSDSESLTFFKGYAELIINTTLSLFSLHGIMLEGHLQNINLRVANSCKTDAVIYHDSADAAVFLPIYRIRNIANEQVLKHEESSEQINLVFNEFFHSTIGANLITIGNQIAIWNKIDFNKIKHLIRDSLTNFMDNEFLPLIDDLEQTDKELVINTMSKIVDNALNSEIIPNKKMFSRYYKQTQTSNYGSIPNPDVSDSEFIPTPGKMKNILTNKTYTQQRI